MSEEALRSIFVEVLAYGSLESATVFELPVESGVRALSVFVGIQRMDLAVIVRPDGRPARDGDPGVTIQSFQLEERVTAPFRIDVPR